MQSDLRNLIDSHEVISFDVFDTLIHRLASHAWSVPKLMELRLRYHDLTKQYPFLGTSFSTARRNAEHTARIEREKFEEDSDVNFNEIYEVLQELLGLPKEVIIELQNLELDTESKVLYADPNMKKAFNYAREQGKIIVLCSDMYLPWTSLGYLVESCGYDLKGVTIYVSCDYRVSKYDGELFTHLPQGKKILHIGDNEHSDLEMAMQQGLDAYHYNYRDSVPNTFSFAPSLTQSLIDGIITKMTLERGDISALELLGLQTYGPLVAGFLIWLFSKVEKKKYDKILFFARDASVFYRAIEKHLKDIELNGERIFTKLPPIDYVYISRKAVTLPALFDIDLLKIARMMSGRGKRSVREWLKLYNIENAASLAGEIQAVGFASEETIVNGTDPRLHGLLQQAYRQVLESSSAAKEEAIKYFDQFQGKKIAIIDLGWLGSLQQNFTKLLALSNSSVKVDGYYFHLWQLPQYSRASLHDNFYAYLREHGNDLFADLPDLIQTGGVELLEDVLSGSHGTTLGYLDAEPVLEDKESTIDLSPLQDAAIAFFDNLLPILRMIPPQTLDSLDWTRPFFRMVEFPTMQEADVLGEIQHSDVAGMTEQSLVPLAGKLEEYMLSDKEVYKTAEKTSFWKQGFKLRNKAAYKKKK